jgi:protein kinase C substrate 80K-H
MSLRAGYNPNYQDMAVLEAVRGWEAIEGITSTESEAQEEPTQEPEDESEEAAWTEEQLEKQLDGLIEQDYLSLILSHESYLETANGASLCEYTVI